MSVLASVRPSDWTEQRFGTLFERAQQTGFPELQPLSVFLGAGVVPRSARDDNHNQLGADLSKYQRVQPADIVFNKLRTWQGGFGVSNYEGIVSPAYIVCRPRGAAVAPRFAHHLLRSAPYLAELTRLSKWMPPSQFDISWDEIRSLPLALPPIDTQKRIADFLDDQVARVDNIIAARHQQQALIEEALTARLAELFFIGSTVPMRRLVREAVVGIVVQPAKYYVDASCGVPALRGTNVDEGEISTVDLVEISHEGHRIHPRSQLIARDVVVVRTGDAGAACVVPDWAIGWNCIDLVIVRANGATEPQYIEHALNAARRNTAIAAAASGSIQQHFGVGALLDLPVRWRGPDEQRKVVASADEARDYANAGSRVLAESIAMLGELKRSLITAAVTGEFDVSAADGSRVSV